MTNFGQLGRSSAIRSPRWNPSAANATAHASLNQSSAHQCNEIATGAPNRTQ